MNAGFELCQRKKLRGGCDKLLAAVQASSRHWPERFKCFMMHCTILRELHFRATDADMKTLRKQFLQNDREPPHFRVQASFTLGVLESNRMNRDEAANMYRQGVNAAENATAKERAGRVQGDDKVCFVGECIDCPLRMIRSNLSIISGNGQTHTCKSPRDFGGKDAMPSIGDVSLNVVENGLLSALELALLQDRALFVGGNECDSCTKPLLELNNKKCCSRCKLVYYCSPLCQKIAWKAGHKKACRKPDEIVPGDYMLLANLVKKPELNGRVVCVKRAATTAGRWLVTTVDNTVDAPLSIATKNLRRIRPESAAEEAILRLQY